VNRKKYTNVLCNQTAENLGIKIRGSFPKLSFESLNTRSLPSTKKKNSTNFSHNPHPRPENGNCNVYRNAGTAAAKPRQMGL